MANIKINPIALFCVCLLLVSCVQALPFQPCSAVRYPIVVESVEMFPTKAFAGKIVDFTFHLLTSVEISSSANKITVEQVLLSKIPQVQESRRGPYSYCGNTSCSDIYKPNDKFDLVVRQKMPLTPGPKSLQVRLLNQNSRLMNCANVDFSNQVAT